MKVRLKGYLDIRIMIVYLTALLLFTACCEFILNSFQDSLVRSVTLLSIVQVSSHGAKLFKVQESLKQVKTEFDFGDKDYKT